MSQTQQQDARLVAIRCGDTICWIDRYGERCSSKVIGWRTGARGVRLLLLRHGGELPLEKVSGRLRPGADEVRFS
jgi:hypothetical protein